MKRKNIFPFLGGKNIPHFQTLTVSINQAEFNTSNFDQKLQGGAEVGLIVSWGANVIYRHHQFNSISDLKDFF